MMKILHLSPKGLDPIKQWSSKMKAAIYIASFIIAVALLIDVYFVYLHFFNEDLIRQIIK